MPGWMCIYLCVAKRAEGTLTSHVLFHPSPWQGTPRDAPTPLLLGEAAPLVSLLCPRFKVHHVLPGILICSIPLFQPLVSPALGLGKSPLNPNYKFPFLLRPTIFDFYYWPPSLPRPVFNYCSWLW